MLEEEGGMNRRFYAMMSRMKYIERWALMRNSVTENISEHSLEVAMLSHALAVISNVRCGKHLNVERAALLGLYHDCTEIITGDLPTPVKYGNSEIRQAYKEVEKIAGMELLHMLPDDMQPYYRDLFFPRDEEAYLWKLEKAADKLSALIKCMEEEKAGNSEFLSAKKATLNALEEMKLPEVDIFLSEFLPEYEKNLDELRRRD